MRILFLILALHVVSIGISVSQAFADTIKIGQTGPLSGPTAANGLALMHGTQALFKRVNDAGGINGNKIELVHVDDGYEPDRTLKAYEDLVKRDKVFALLTVYGAPNTLAIAPALERDDVPLVGAISSANMTEPLRKNVFMVRMSGHDETEHMVQQAVTELGIKDFAAFYQDDAFGMSGRSGAQKALAARGLDLKAFGVYKRNTSDVKAAVETIAAAKAKAVVITGLAPATVEFIKEMTAKGARPIYFGGSPVSAPPFIKQAGELKLDYFSSLATPLPDDNSYEITAQFQKDMKAAGFTDANHIFALEAYINASVLVEGLRNAGKKPTRDSFRAALEKMTNFNVGGVHVSFSPTNHKGLKRLYMAKLEAGKLVPIKSMSLAGK